MEVRKPHAVLILSLLLTGLVAAAQAEVKLASVFGDSMVLQQEMEVPIWGTGEPGEQVTVEFGEQKKTVAADQDGRWQVRLAPTKANATGQTLTVTGKNTIILKDVLVGEVWICSGQSNMEWPLSRSLNGPAEVAKGTHPAIRLFNVPGHTISSVPQDTCPGAWQLCDPKTAAGFSGVGYFFGRRIQRELNVPVGLVGSNWGGTRIEPWISPDGLASVPALKALSDRVKSYTAGKKLDQKDPCAIYHAMVHPLVPFAMRGAIWYQGESNGDEGESYFQKTQALVNGWRKDFNPELAFYWVQLANFKDPHTNPAGGDGWAKLREAQRKALNIKHTGMAVIIDIGEAGNIHPKNKQDVGWRLAQWALHQTYGKKELVPAGPLYKSHQVDGNAIRISFDHVGSGLMVGKKTGLEPTQEVKGGRLNQFAIAGTNKKWHWAEATIEGENVVVRAAEVPAPVAVRYAFSMNPAGANLFNKEGLPASPFRTDEW